MYNIPFIAQNLPEAPIAWKFIIYNNEEREVVAVAYDTIFAVTNNKRKWPWTFGIDDYVRDAEIRIKEEREQNELARELDK